MLTSHGMRLILFCEYIFFAVLLDCNNACLLNWKVILIDIAKTETI